ncbi:hypothetical protein J2Y45_006498 [Dyadobacter sp. BE34]|uniref:Uncharacterized protein n=1 Tax=Dyadobacter fermentans TaxID=94254 RepID=A0ABU1QXL2_9BACT|nr:MULTISPECIES: hypothetical protein [Dyadobacter]MDR6805902.1 hypothetical protein [Dyadobacter fermentans]MDR7042337.1 hypothetical protein [Dyadobacter sp. BE242]MDR7201335.1 hypothetical protein [Dyadobacter sp. BE34]MDR7215916.1 hypothetical protein [Dyadobacter sp. BE31]MDR7263452.1 hypothetical protein [Dyadobacter sp. BE32]
MISEFVMNKKSRLHQKSNQPPLPPRLLADFAGKVHLIPSDQRLVKTIFLPKFCSILLQQNFCGMLYGPP